MSEHGDGWDVIDRLLAAGREAPEENVILTPKERDQLLTLLTAWAKSIDDAVLYEDHSSAE